MIENYYLLIILVLSFLGIKKDLSKSKWAQFSTCFLFALLFIGRDFIYYWSLIEFDFKNERYLINNSTRIIQHICLIFIVLKVTYKDHRAILPILLSTVIVVLYCLSNILILNYPLDSVNPHVNGSRDIQKIIYSSRVILGSLSVLSLIDYGDNVYGKLFKYFNISRNTLIGNLLPSFQLSEGHSILTKEKKDKR